MNTSVTLLVTTIDKNNINKESLRELFESDSDFLENEDYFRDDTLALGFENEAQRVSEEIFKARKRIKDESERVGKMVKDCFNVSGFIGQSSYYHEYEYEITETEFAYVVSIAVITG